MASFSVFIPILWSTFKDCVVFFYHWNNVTSEIFSSFTENCWSMQQAKSAFQSWPVTWIHLPYLFYIILLYTPFQYNHLLISMFLPLPLMSLVLIRILILLWLHYWSGLLRDFHTFKIIFSVSPRRTIYTSSPYLVTSFLVLSPSHRNP